MCFNYYNICKQKLIDLYLKSKGGKPYEEIRFKCIYRVGSSTWICGYIICLRDSAFIHLAW